MTIDVDFYILAQGSVNNRYLIACRLIEKAYQKKLAVFINTANAQEAKHIDDLLWTYKDISFIPHTLIGSELALNIQIGHDHTPTTEYDILLNLAPEVPNYFQQFKRIMEIVPNDDTWRQTSRKNYRFYRDNGCELKTHQL